MRPVIVAMTSLQCNTAVLHASNTSFLLRPMRDSIRPIRRVAPDKNRRVEHDSPVADYDLHKLSTREFEHLAQALCLKEFGVSVEIFGDGSDNGREAMYDGRLAWSGDDSSLDWTGGTVIQAKFLQEPRGTVQDTAWLKKEIKNEMSIWRDKKSTRRCDIGLPDNILFITNVTLGPGSGGGIDTVRALLKDELSQAGMTSGECWHFDKLCRLLDGQKDVRSTFAGLITPGDIIEHLRDMLVGESVDVGIELIKHAERSILADQFIRLSESGDPQQARLRINQVAIDLPARLGEQVRADAGALRSILHNKRSLHMRPHALDSRAQGGAAEMTILRGNKSLRKSVLQAQGAYDPPHLVIVGGPGQGKTTLSQLIATVYRAAFVGERLEGPSAKEIPGLDDTNAYLRSIGLPVPTNRRWPLRIDLAQFASDVATGGDVNLLKWVANEVSKNSHQTITAAQLYAWLNNWPWLVILDGFDEVASVMAREAVTGAVRTLLDTASDVDADLFVVVTTRPQGYVNDFGNSNFDHIYLDELPQSVGLKYARSLIELRHIGDPSQQGEVYRRVCESAERPVTARLMRTPLQVTIMTLLAETARRAPQSRYALFDAYYDTIYRRESNKMGATAELLGRHREDIDGVHEQVSFLLQCQEETTAGAEAAMPRDDVREVAIRWLEAEGNTRVDAERIAEKIISAATERLVLLVPKGAAEVGFEVRSLQEYMCARAVASGESDDIIKRLRTARFSAHWRNVWLLSVGRVFATRAELKSRLVDLVRDKPSAAEEILVPTGQQLALELLNDGISPTSPKYRKQLLDHALTIFEYTHGTVRYEENAKVFGELAAENAEYRKRIVYVLKQRLDQGLATVVLAWGTVHAIREDKSNPLYSSLNQLLPRAQREEIETAVLLAWVGLGYPVADTSILRTTDAGSISEVLRSIFADGNELKRKIFDALEGIGLVSVDHQGIILLGNDPIMRTIRYPVGAYTAEGIADELAQIAMEIDSTYWCIHAYLADYTRRLLSYQPIAQEMLATFEWGEVLH